jgi:hypothetical protein
VLIVVTDSHAFGILTFSLARGVVGLLSLLFFVNKPEISVSQSRRSCEKGGVGIFEKAVNDLYIWMSIQRLEVAERFTKCGDCD